MKRRRLIFIGLRRSVTHANLLNFVCGSDVENVLCHLASFSRSTLP